MNKRKSRACAPVVVFCFTLTMFTDALNNKADIYNFSRRRDKYPTLRIRLAN